VSLDDILVDLKLPPETLEIPVPRYIRDDHIRQLAQRDRTVSRYMKMAHDVERMLLEADKEGGLGFGEEMGLERAIEVIQRAERGRQGKERALLFQSISKSTQGGVFNATSTAEMDHDIAATNIQRVFRGFSARIATDEERENELVFVGMRPGKDRVESLQKQLDISHRKRKQLQVDNKEAYEQALIDLQGTIMEEEAGDIMEQLREERAQWLTDQIAQEKFPENLQGFYLMKNPHKAELEPAEPKANKSAKKGKEKSKKSKGSKKRDKKSKNKAPEKEKVPERPPPFQGPSEIARMMYETAMKHESVWESKDEKGVACKTRACEGN
jgi:hypothetical protein